MFSIDTDALLKQFLYDPQNPLLFNNGFFVFFFGIFMLLYYLFRHQLKTRRYIFCAFSLYFFYKASGDFVALVILSAIVNFFISRFIHRAEEKAKKLSWLVVSILFNLGLLFYFKYTNFFIALSNDIFSTGINPLNILLPVGISFFTFENLSYTIDVYRKQFEPAKNFTDYLLFLSFFPKLVMGPIVRANDFVPQINQPYHLIENDFAKGFYLIISGLIKKMIISDYLTLNYVNYIFDNPGRYTGLENLMAVYAYAVVIYCDFSGYSDVAIGIAKWLGFTIPPNFLSPYQSKNITEFWRRWHISLSSWLKDYLYIPLGGNRSSSVGTWIFSLLFFAGTYAAGTHLLQLSPIAATSIAGGILLLFLLPAIIEKKPTGVAANMNLLTTMLLGGFWHGASWNFIIWGALHGIALAIHKVWMLLTGKNDAPFKQNQAYRILMVLVTFHFVCFCWIFFKAEDFEVAQQMIAQIGNNFDLSVWNAFWENYWSVVVMMSIAYLLHTFPDNYADKIIGRYKKVPLIVYMLLFFGFVILYGYFKSSEQVLPIYLQF